MCLPLAFVALAALLALTAPAAAAPAGSSDYQLAMDIFLGGQMDPMKYTGSYAETVTRGLDGTWAPLLSLPAGAGFGDLLARVCQGFPATIRTTPEHGFVLTRANVKTKSQFDVVFTPMGGNMFGQYSAAAGIFGYLGMKEGAGDVSARLNVLRTNNGTAIVNRIGDSILVIQSASNLPALYGRCE
jgi:hypothetical protein